MRIKLPCVQSTELGVCFTDFTSPDSIIDCVVSILKVGRGLSKDRKINASVEILFHEHYGDLYIPRSFRFFFDMCPIEVAEYLDIELKSVIVECV